jgi:hypothetical protein
MTLRLSKSLILPPEAVTQTFAILGKRGSGKTTTATVLTEELLDAGHHVVVIDPLDVTWGLRSSRDGKSAGYPITVLGGDHADLPLEATAGAVLAEFVVTHHSPVILSLRHFSMGDQRRFVTDFCEKLYALKGQTANRVPLHLVIDEADEFCPQRIQHGQERMFGAIDRIVRRGRSAGLGVTLISQRAAVLHKDVLSQAEVLVCHQTISPQDRKALEAWIQAHDAHGQAKEFMGSLASLARGEAWVWSPGWLNVFQRVPIRDRRTFDSSATPKPGALAAQPKALAAVDLDALRSQIASTVEQAKANDPALLRKRIAELERELAKKPAAAVERVEIPAVSAEMLGEFLALVQRIEVASTQLQVYEGKLRDDLAKVNPSAPTRRDRERHDQAAHRYEQQKTAAFASHVQKRIAASGGGDAGLSRAAERKVLTALAHYPDGRTVKQVAILAGYAMNGGGFRNAVGKLKSLGYVEAPSPAFLRITREGQAAIGDVDPLPTGPALIAHWMGQLDRKAEREILQVLVDAYPRALTADAIATKTETGYEANGGGFRNALGKLRTLELVTGRGEMRASEELFA